MLGMKLLLSLLSNEFRYPNRSGSGTRQGSLDALGIFDWSSIHWCSCFNRSSSRGEDQSVARSGSP